MPLNMMVESEHIVAEAKQFVTDLLEKHLPEGFHYHNLEHTCEVLKHAETIGRHEGLSGRDLTLLKLGALFHDVGYVDCYEGHEEAGIVYARDFMRTRGADDDEVRDVSKAILATKVPHVPVSDIGRMLCDADLFYLSDANNYFVQAEHLRMEWDVMGIRSMKEMEFHKNSLDFFAAHTFHTNYGKLFLQPGKENVEKLIRERIYDAQSENDS